MSADAEPSAYALLNDGTTIEIRPARADDLDAVRDMHTKMSTDNLYLRFFGVSSVAAEQESAPALPRARAGSRRAARRA